TWSEAQIEQGAAQVLQQQKSKAETVLVQARTGASFAQLANQNDPRAQKTRSGGDIGFRQKSQLPKEIADILWKMKPGDVMQQLLQDPLGFHIMKVTAHDAAGPAPMADVRDYLKANIVMAKGGEYVTKWLEEKRKVAKIDFAPEFAAMLGDQTKLGALPPGAKPADGTAATTTTPAPETSAAPAPAQ
ncbi:MAG: peptidyl-prolyl cis-trans isomerase, partial [Candidatus Obscuribacterales bacterium]|nr:peptidyl-prolyl cis-trans isomerase [Candidatus Obscuribacterales bacterium]